jgi:hypothetical protein
METHKLMVCDIQREMNDVKKKITLIEKIWI